MPAAGLGGNAVLAAKPAGTHPGAAATSGHLFVQLAQPPGTFYTLFAGWGAPSSPSLEYIHCLSTSCNSPWCSHLRAILTVRDNPQGEGGVCKGEAGDTHLVAFSTVTHTAMEKEE